MGGYCVVSNCKNRGGHGFPKDKKLRKAWIDRIRREASWTPSSHSKVCHEHFTDDDYLQRTAFGAKPIRKELKPGAVPSVFWWKADRQDQGRDVRKKRRLAKKEFEEEVERRMQRDPAEEQVQFWVDEFESRETVPDPVIEVSVVTTASDDIIATSSGETVVDETEAGVSCPPTAVCHNLENNKCVGADFRSGYLDINNLRRPNDLTELTGCPDQKQFHLLVAMFEPEYKRQKCLSERISPNHLSFSNKLFLTLVKLKHNFTCRVLGVMFDVAGSTAAETFRFMIALMHRVLRQIKIWPTDYDQNLPVVIVDCTELKIARPSNPTLQSQTYSTYKSTNTVKILIGITPRGAISFVSDAYSGSSSDQQVFERSGIILYLREGDTVLADRGFNVQHCLAAKGVKVITPAFLKGRAQLLPSEVIRSRMITRQRIHVERLIGLTKTYAFVRGPIHYKHVPIISQAYYVASFLCNLRPCIVTR